MERGGFMTGLAVLSVCWKMMTNREIRTASTGSQSFKAKELSSDLYFSPSKIPIDKPHPWLLVELEHKEETYLLAFSRNSAHCQFDREDGERLGPPYVWLNHKHDWHICSVIDDCGKVNFNLEKKSEWPTFWNLASIRAFKSINQKPICNEEDPSLIAGVLQSSNIIGRLKAKAPPSPSLAFLNTLKKR